MNDTPDTLLEITDLKKQFGGIQALKGVGMSVAPGEIHGLVGANGAGKSTLIRVLAGIVNPDGGVIKLNDREVNIRDPQHARELGLSFIHQELNLVPKFNGLQNLTLGLPKPKKFGFVDWPAMRRQVQPVIDRMGISFPLDVPAEDLSVAEQWLLSIGRALVLRSRLIAMDEPTASLSPDEVDHLFRVIRDLSSDNIAVIYVTHRLHEIETLCHRVTVLKDGQKVAELGRSELKRDELVKAIVGEITVRNRSSTASSERAFGQEVLSVRDLTQRPKVLSVSFELHAGEILGLGGLVGAGRTELVRLLFGLEKRESGEILIDGRPVKIAGPHDAMRHGMGLIPEERRTQGLMLLKSISFNMNITDLRSLRTMPLLPFVNLRNGRARATDMAKRLELKAGSMDDPARTLSGGNQQKVVIGKWLIRRPRILILDEPTRGVDIGARAEIYGIIRELASSGTAILLVSSDVEELVEICDRVLVMVEGRTAGTIEKDDISEENILRLSYAHGEHQRAF